MSDNGWVKIHRSIKDWEWYKTPHMAHLYQHLILMANHEPKKWQGKVVTRGQFVTGLPTLSKQTGISVQSIRTCLERLKSTGEITNTSTNKGRLITICNYDSYQEQGETANRQINRLANIQSTFNQQTTNRQLTANKNIKNIKNTISTTSKNNFSFDLETGNFEGIKPEDIDRWEKAYPAVDINLSIRQSAEWLMGHPTQLKSNYRRFLTGWFLREQDRGGNKRKESLFAQNIGDFCKCGQPADKYTVIDGKKIYMCPKCSEARKRKND